MKKEQQTLSTIQWLHRYIFRGIGVAFLAGIITWLYLFLRAGAHR